MPRRNALSVAACAAAVLAVGAASVDARAEQPVPTSMPGCVYFAPATTSSPPYCVPERRDEGPLDGLNAVGAVGAGLTMAGIAGTTMGVAIAMAGNKGRDGDEALMTGGGVTAGVGVLLILVGAPMWVLGKDDDRATKVGVGAGSVHMSGTF